MTVHLHRRESFLFLLEDTCRELGLPPPPPPHDHGDESLAIRLVVGQIPFELSFHADLPHDSFLLDCVMGPCPRDGKALVALLQANLELMREEHGCLGCRSDSDSVVLSSWLSLHDTNGRQLSGAMQDLAEQAVGWRDRVAVGGGHASD